MRHNILQQHLCSMINLCVDTRAQKKPLTALCKVFSRCGFFCSEQCSRISTPPFRPLVKHFLSSVKILVLTLMPGECEGMSLFGKLLTRRAPGYDCVCTRPFCTSGNPCTRRNLPPCPVSPLCTSSHTFRACTPFGCSAISAPLMSRCASV